MKWSKDILPTPVLASSFTLNIFDNNFPFISANSSQTSNMTYLNLENNSLSKKMDAFDIYSPTLSFDFFF